MQASVFSIRGSALFVSFLPSLTARPVHFPPTRPSLSFVIAQSFVAADKHVTGPVCYNLRVVECSLAAALLHAVLNKSSSPLPPDSGPLGISLRGFQTAYFKDSTKSFEDQLKELIDLTKNTLIKKEGYTREEIAPLIHLSVDELNTRFTSTFPVRATHFMLRQRALHVFSEALRVLQFMDVLENHPTSTDTTEFNKKLGDLMDQTQDSCREGYDCSCPELDEICRIAKRAGSYGSRLTGAGWGGCSVHLVPSDKVEAVREAWEKEYYSKMDLTEEQKVGSLSIEVTNSKYQALMLCLQEAAVVVSKPGSGSAVYIVEGDLV
jgi:galactokinase